MSGRLQAVLALCLAFGAHLALFSAGPGPAGAGASGAGGEALISLEAADASLSALIESWDAPPEVAEAPPVDLTPQVVPPDLPQVSALSEPAPRAAPAPAITPPATPEAPPQIAPPPPLPEAPPVVAAVPEPRPQPRPDPAPQPPKTRPKTDPPPKPAKPAKATPPAQPAQKAAGKGKGAAAGNGGTAKAATLSKSQLNSLKSGWGAEIRARIERKKAYPRAAKGAAGKVTVRLTVNRAGQLIGVAVARSSGNAALDQAAVKAVKAAGRFPAAPKGLGEGSYSFTLPMSFSR